MRHNKPSWLLLGLGVCCGALLTLGVASAGTGGGYDLTWHSFDGGGVTFATGGGYSLGATVGQADAAVATGGSYTLRGGFWQSFDENKGVYLPVVSR